MYGSKIILIWFIYHSLLNGKKNIFRRLSVPDGLFGTASALSTILLVSTGLALFIVNKFLGVGKNTIVG